MTWRNSHTLVIGSRASKLALWQTRFVASTLRELFPEVEFHIESFKTIGDDIVDRPLPELGGKGVFTARLESALLRGDVDLAVHSLKDLPIEIPQGLTLGAVTRRADARDVLVTRDGVDLYGLGKGAVVGTSSLRRQAQLLALRSDLQVRPIRGNVETRLQKVMEGRYDATILAAAGVDRLGLDVAGSARLAFDVMLPAPGQGALAVQCRADDECVLKLLRAIDHDETRRATAAERAFLTELGGGCAAPVAAYARVAEAGVVGLAMIGLVAEPQGRRLVRVEGNGSDPATFGKRLAVEAIAQGAKDILLGARAALEARLPLRARRIAVTRAADQAEELCAALSGLGATPVRVPMIRTVPIADEATVRRFADGSSPGDWVVFTSVNGVTAWWRALNGEAGGKLFEGLRVAAVGTATAGALEHRSVAADFVPTDFAGEAIGREMPDVAGRNVWLLRAESAGRTIVDVLQSRGARVQDVPVYRTVPLGITAAAAKDLERGLDAILFTSASTVRSFGAACADRGWGIQRFNRCVIACIGSATEQAAREVGFTVSVTPTEHTMSALVNAVADHFNEVRR